MNPRNGIRQCLLLLVIVLVFSTADRNVFAANNVGDRTCGTVDVTATNNRLIDLDPGDRFWLTLPKGHQAMGVYMEMEGHKEKLWLGAGESLPVQYDKPGTYTIRLRTSYGVALAPFTVRVFAPPADLVQPQQDKKATGGLRALAASSPSPSFSVGSVYAGQYGLADKFPIRIVCNGVGNCTLTKYGGGWSRTYYFCVPGETSDVVDVPAGAVWTLVKSCGGTQTLSRNNPNKLHVENIVFLNGPSYAPPIGTKVANTNWFVLTNDVVTLQVLPGPNWVTNNPTASASLFAWTTNGLAFPPSTNLTQTFSPASGTNFVDVYCLSPSAPSNQITTIVGIPVTLKLSVDTDRNGVIDNNDEPGKDQWTIQRGAFVTVDEWIVGNMMGVPTVNIDSLAAVIVYPFGTLPVGWSVKLKVYGSAGLVLTTGQGGILVGPSPAEQVLAWVGSPVTFRAVATKDLSLCAGDSVAKASLELYNPQNSLFCSNTVAMQVAPIILAWNSLPLERLYCANVSPAHSFPASVCPGRQGNYWANDIWVQDMMELGKSAFSTINTLDQVVDLKLKHDINGISTITSTPYIQNNLLPEGGNSVTLQWHRNTWTNEGNGGNIEVFPSYVDNTGTNYPYGRVVMGSDRAAALPFIAAQKIQDPIEVTLDWLAVGHIDEVFCFLRDTAMLVADPATAWLEVIEMVNVPGRETTVLAGNQGYWFDMQDVTNDVNFFFSQTLPLEQPLGISDTTFTVTQGEYTNDNYLLIEREVVRVTGVTMIGGQTILGVVRGQLFGNSAQSHAAGVRIRKLSDEFVGNVYDVGSEERLYKRIDDMKLNLYQQLGTTTTSVKVPVVFGNVSNGRCAASANMVNCVVDGNDIYATDPGNRRFQELFQSFVSETVHWVNDPQVWDDFHCKHGDLHCGSNAKRSFPSSSWWSDPEYANWPN